MAYNFPVSYQPAQVYYPQVNNVPMNNAPQAQQPQQNNSSIIWVQGEAGAKSYLVAPNTTVQLWDSEEQVIYLKSADASGMPSIKTLEYTVRDATVPSKDVSDVEDKYISKEELKALQRKIERLRDDVDKMKHNGKKKGEEE